MSPNRNEQGGGGVAIALAVGACFVALMAVVAVNIKSPTQTVDAITSGCQRGAARSGDDGRRPHRGCQAAHVCYFVSGRMHVVMDGGAYWRT